MRIDRLWATPFTSHDLVLLRIEPDRFERVGFRRVKGEWRRTEFVTRTKGEDETIYQTIRRAGPHSPAPAKSNLVLVPSPHFYSHNANFYPKTLGAKGLSQALEYDWSENLLFEPESRVHCHGPADPDGEFFRVPLFDMEGDTLKNLKDSVRAGEFRRVVVVPSRQALAEALPEILGPGADERGWLCLDGPKPEQGLETCGFGRGRIGTCFLLRPQGESGRMFRAGVQAQGVERRNGGRFFLLLDHGLGPTSLKEKKEIEEARGSALGFDLTLLCPVRPLAELFALALLKKGGAEGFNETARLTPVRLPGPVWAALLVLLALCLFGAVQTGMRTGLERELETAQLKLRQAKDRWRPIESRRLRLARLRQTHALLAEYLASSPPALELVTLLTRITPDQVWLEKLSLKDGALRLRCVGPSATSYHDLLLSTPGFERAVFASSVTRTPNSDKERFTLDVKVNPDLLARDSVATEPQ